MVQILLAIVILGTLIWWLNRQRQLGGRRPQRLHKSNRSAGIVPESLMRRLDRLTRDRRVSERLIERIAFNNPGRSKRWCVEKAIYDLQRDRRS